jgi:RNA methyltransferase, TrmH family
MLSKACIKDLRRLSLKKTRVEEGRFLLEGWHLLEDALRAGVPLEAVIVAEPPEDAARRELMAQARASAGEILEAFPEQMGQFCESVTPPGVAAVARWSPVGWEVARQAAMVSDASLVVALDAVGEPGNVGAILRTADWFGAKAVLVGQGSAELLNPKTVRATQGSLFHLPAADGVDLMEALGILRGDGFELCGATLSGEADLRQVVWGARTVLVIGNEARGISPGVSALLGRRIRIPGWGQAESLNAAVAAGVLLAQWRLSRS